MFSQELQRTSVTMIQYIKKYLNSKIIVRYLSAIFVTPPSKTKLHCVAPNYAVVSLHFRAIINRRGELAENNQHGLFILSRSLLQSAVEELMVPHSPFI